MIKFLFLMIIIVGILLFIINDNNDNQLNNNTTKYVHIKKPHDATDDQMNMIVYESFNVIKKSKHIINKFKISFIDEY